MGRFLGPDTVVPAPGNPQSLNRYAYVLNNPLRYTDPSGHALSIDELGHMVAHPMTGRPTLRVPAPPVIAYIHEEMVQNVQSTMAMMITIENFLSRIGNDFVAKGAAWGLWGSQVMDAKIKDYVGPLAPLLGNWDHKPILKDEKSSPVPEIPSERPGKPKYWSTVGSTLYYYDIWSNIHYGYVGRASGFSQPELTGGAGVEQIGSRLVDQRLPHRSEGADNWLASWDDSSDNAAIQIGIRMWNEYALAVTPADLYLAVLEEPRLATLPLGGRP